MTESPGPVADAQLADLGIRRAVDDGKEGVTSEAERRADTLASVLNHVAWVVVAVFFVLTSLQEFGINVGPLIAGAGIAGVALGFGAQSLVKDFLSGLFMILEDQYGVKIPDEAMSDFKTVGDIASYIAVRKAA